MSAMAARFLVFFTSAAVLVLEILAGRLLAPYVGVTLETFTGIIGTVLAGISLGSWLGGRAADRYPPRRLLGPLLIAGGLLTVLAPAIVTGVGGALGGNDPVQIVALTATGFFAPAVVLSAVTPVVVKIRLTSLDETGAVVGRLAAIGTGGAIFGTFVTGFVLLAALPSRPILIAVGGTLIATGLALSRRLYRPARAVVLAVLAGALVATGLNMAVAGPCEVETAYYCARVTTDESRPTGRVLWLDTLRHSYVDLEDPSYLHFRYVQVIADVVEAAAPPGPIDALYIGGGGFTLPRWLSARRPGSTNTVLELDRELVDLAERRLGLDPGEIDRIEVGDARVTLRRTPDAVFEVVVGDAFGGESVPWHLTTHEFVAEVSDHTSPDGLYVMNLIDEAPARFARAEAATLAAVFEYVVVIAPTDYLYGASGGNYVLAASNRPLDVDSLQTRVAVRSGEELVITGEVLDAWIDGANPLTDEFAPVDQLISRDR